MVDPSLRPDRKFCSQDRKTGGFSRDSCSKHYCCGEQPGTTGQRQTLRKQTVPLSYEVHWPWVTYAPFQPRKPPTLAHQSFCTPYTVWLQPRCCHDNKKALNKLNLKYGFSTGTFCCDRSNLAVVSWVAPRMDDHRSQVKVCRTTSKRVALVPKRALSSFGDASATCLNNLHCYCQTYQIPHQFQSSHQ